MIRSVAEWLSGPGPALGLATLSAAVAFAPGRLAAWPRPGRTAARAASTLAALAVVAAAATAAPFVLAAAGQSAWQAPAERLFAILALCAVAAVAADGDQGSRRPRALPSTLAGAAAARRRRSVPLALAAVAGATWLAVAPGWAAAVRAGEAAALSHAVLSDMALAAAALVLAAATARRTAKGAPTAVPVLGALALGSACQALWPAAAAAPLWRAGLVAAGAAAAVDALPAGAAHVLARLALRAVVAVGLPRLRAALAVGARRRAAGAVTAQAAAAGRRGLGRATGLTTTALGRATSAIDRLAASAGRLVAAARDAAAGAARAVGTAHRSIGRRSGRRADRHRAADSARARLALAGALADALHGALSELDAAVVFAGLIDGEQVQFWALTPSGALQELYRRPLNQLAAVRRTLLSGAAAFGSRTEARDIDDLYQHLGLPYGGPALAAAGGRPARVVLIAGSGYGPWRRDDPARLADAAAYLADRLTEIDAPPPLATVAPPPAAVVEDVARLEAALAALHAEVAQVAARLDGVERRLDGQAAVTAAAGPGQLAPSPAASYLARLETFQRLFEPLPWGLVVADAGGRVVLANTAARRLLVGSALLPGHRIDIPTPGARMLVGALRDPASTLHGSRIALAPLDAVVRVEPIEPPHERHRRRLGATLAIATAADAAARGEADLVDLLEALRDPLVDLRIQGESLEAEVQIPSPDLLRHLTVLDGHVAGLRAVLGALVARRRLSLRRHIADVGAIDLGHLGATTELELRDLFALRGIRFRGVRGDVPPGVALDVGLLEQVAMAMVAGVVSTASWGSHLSVQLRHEPDPSGRPGGAVVVEVDLLDGGLTPIRQRAVLDAAALDAHTAALRVSQTLAHAGFPGCEAWFSRRQPTDQRLQLCLRVPVGAAAA